MAYLTTLTSEAIAWARSFINSLHYVHEDRYSITLDIITSQTASEVESRPIMLYLCLTATIRDVRSPSKLLYFIMREPITSMCMDRAESAILEVLWRMLDGVDQHERMERLRWRDGRPIWEPHRLDGSPHTSRQNVNLSPRPS